MLQQDSEDRLGIDVSADTIARRSAVDVPPHREEAALPPSLARDPAAEQLIVEGKATYKSLDYRRSEECFLEALRLGSDEATCHLHLARIYNFHQDWVKALDHWTWLRKQDPTQMEPHLQVARANYRLGRLLSAEKGFNAVLLFDPLHQEARTSLDRLKVELQTERLKSDAISRSWISDVPSPGRWEIASKVLTAEIAGLQTAIETCNRQAAALTQSIEAFRTAEGPVHGARQRYADQSADTLDRLSTQLVDARRLIRQLAAQGNTVIASLNEFSSEALPPLSLRSYVPRAAWREALTNVAGGIVQERGFDTALSWLFGVALVQDRTKLLADLGSGALREIDRNAAVAALWMAYGATPSAEIAERMASRMFQMGDLSNAAALIERGPRRSSSDVVNEMRSTAAMFRHGIEIPPAAATVAGGSDLRLGYVASGSLPFQSVGYAIRTHQLLIGLKQGGVACTCFTRPGYPWDRPRVWSGDIAETDHTIGPVRYVHTELPNVRDDPENMVAMMSAALEQRFRDFGCNIVQAASNSRNALPALIAARKVGARFIYEVRGLWELTAASRIPGWETTERYKFDRDLEVLVARSADHVLTITNGVAQELIASGVPAERISLLPNSVDPDAFMPRPKDASLTEKLNIQPDEFVAVYAGSLTIYEGLDDLVVALSLLRRQGYKARFVVAGDGEVRQSLQDVAAGCGMQEFVQFVGRVQPEEIQAYLSIADVVAIPRKPFKVCEVVTPLKPLEAMSMEIPVVLTDLAALREMVIDGETGLLCKPADPDDLAAVLKRLADDPALRRRLGTQAREWVSQHRSWAGAAAGLKQRYAALLGQNTQN